MSKVVDYVILKLFFRWLNSMLDGLNQKLGEINKERGKTIEKAKETLNT